MLKSPKKTFWVVAIIVMGYIFYKVIGFIVAMIILSVVGFIGYRLFIKKKEG